MGLLDGQVVLITGGAPLGRQWAPALARAGARVLLDDRGAEGSPASEVVERLANEGAEVAAAAYGLYDSSSAERLVATAMELWGRVDALVVEVESGGASPILTMEPGDWREAVGRPFDEVHNVLRAALSAWQGSGGTVVFVARGSGIDAPRSVADAVVVHGMLGLAGSLPIEGSALHAYMILLSEDADLDPASGLVLYLLSGAHDVSTEVFGVQGHALKAIDLRVSHGIVKPAARSWTSDELSPRLAELRGAARELQPLAHVPEPGSALDEDTQVAPAGTRAWPIGKRYDGGYWLVDGRDFAAFAAAVDDDNPRYQGLGAIAPPMYHVRPFTELLRELSQDPELELDEVRLIRSEHAMRFRRPLHHGDVLQLRATLEAVEPSREGRRTTFGLYGMVDGELALEGTASYLSPRQEGGLVGNPGQPQDGAPEWTITQVVSDDQAIRYAEASGDHDPIHLDDASAAEAGLPGAVLHDLCVLSLAQRDLVNRFGEGDPTRLTSLAARFLKPGYPGVALTLDVWPGEEGSVTFRTRATDGEVVMEGRAEFSS